jgi:glucoamylase
LRRRVFFILVGLALLGALAPLILFAFSSSRSEWTAGTAPAMTVAPDHWTTGNKDAVGTAYGTASPVWFTAVHGTLADLLYPTVDRDNLRQFGFIVTDGATFFFDASQQGVASSRVTDDRALTYELRVDDTAQHFSLVTDLAANTSNPVVLVRTRLVGGSSRLHVYAYLVPHLGGSGTAQTAFFEGNRGYVSKGGTWLAIGGDTALGARTAGYLGQGDGYDQLHRGALATRYREAGPGHVTLTWEISHSAGWTTALAFGNTRAGADAALDAVLEKGADRTLVDYRDGWRGYALGLAGAPPAAGPNFFYSADVIKMAEDKQHPGAIVASLAVPWGDTATDESVDTGYRKVWPRDLYHAAGGLLAAGDNATAYDVLRFMGRQQQADGSMPQNTNLDGAPIWTGRQLDETADAILLAARLTGKASGPDIARAADYLVANGPATQQERWEEAGGYSPATMAAEIAALRAAVWWSRHTGASTDRATSWESTADRWDAALETDTLTRTGHLAGGSYYLRISPDGKPDSAEPIDLANGGGVWDQREIVDPSFLELVRLGIRCPNDPRVLATLRAVDQASSGSAEGLILWYRYPHDGYGEKNEGSSPPGQGHLWPLLTGERGVYSVLAGRDPSVYWGTLLSLARRDGLLGEQVWEETGDPTGSARPLVWAQAEYIVLEKAATTRRVDDMPVSSRPLSCPVA